MSSIKAAASKRLKKASHFEYEVEMEALNSPHPPHSRREKVVPAYNQAMYSSNTVPVVRPGQPPIQRIPPSENRVRERKEVEEEPFSLSEESRQRLQEIIEAQKSFMKYHQMREILEAKELDKATKYSSKTVQTNGTGVGAADSDKENSVSLSKSSSESSRRPKTRKVAKLLPSKVIEIIPDDKEKGTKRKSEEEVDRVNPVPEKTPKDNQDEKAVHSNRPETGSDMVDNSAQTDGGSRKCDKVTCDWAFWYVPETDALQPARVTIKSRKRVVGKIGCQNNQQKQVAKGIKEVPIPEKEVKTDDKPWRKNMKKSTEKIESIDKEEENKESKPEQEKPWRINMKKDSGDKKEPEIEEPKKEPVVEKPWRANMKKESKVEEKKEEEQPKKRHYNRKEVREFMRHKQMKEREMIKEREEQEQMKQAIIKRRLEELDKLQKHINEVDKDMTKKNKEASSDNKRTERTQHLLRLKLIELTEQMKDQWRQRQGEDSGMTTHSGSSSSQLSLQQGSSKQKISSSSSSSSSTSSSSSKSSESSHHKDLSARKDASGKESTFRDLVDNQDSSIRKDASRIGSRSLDEVDRLRSYKDDFSEVSDATEIKGLSESAKSSKLSHSLEHERSKSGSMNRFSKPEHSILSGPKSQIDEMHQYNNVSKHTSLVEDLHELSNSSGPTPLLDEVPERDMSDAREEIAGKPLRNILSEVFTRHQKDLEYIKNNFKDLDLPKTPTLQKQANSLPTTFEPRYPQVLSTPSSLPPLEFIYQNQNLQRPLQLPSSEPKPVPVLHSDTGSQETINSEKPPQWMNVTMDASEQEFSHEDTELKPVKTRPFNYDYAEQEPVKTIPNNNENVEHKSIKTTPFNHVDKEQHKRTAMETVVQADPNNFMSTVLRKYELVKKIPENNAVSKDDSQFGLSEGVLSPSAESSIASSYAAVPSAKASSASKSKSKHSKKSGSFSGQGGKSVKTISEELQLETDSESTLKDIGDDLGMDSPKRSKERRSSSSHKNSSKSPRRKSLSSSSRSRSRSQHVESMKRKNSADLPSNDIAVVQSVNDAANTVDGNKYPEPRRSNIPEALHLRFTTELNQLETINATEHHLLELEQVKRTALESQRGLEEMQQEMEEQRQRAEAQRRLQENSINQREMQDLYAAKMQRLLESQTEATKVTSDVARQLAEFTQGVGANVNVENTAAVTVVQQLQAMIENLAKKQLPPPVTSTITSASVSASVVQSSVTTSVSASRTVADSSSRKETRSRESVTRQRNLTEEDDAVVSTDGGPISSEIIIEAASAATKSSSSILDLIDQNQRSGNSIQQTISEALASISETEKTKSNITAEVEEELSTDYSSQFEETSTLREKSFRTVLPSESHRRKSISAAEKSRSSKKEYASDASVSSLSTSVQSDNETGKVEAEGGSSGSLFSDNESFTKFTLDMVSQYMQEETIRSQHQKSLLKIKEKALIEKAKKDVEALEKLKQQAMDKGEDDKMPRLRKKQRSVLLQLKERQAELARMRDSLKVAERERKFLAQQQKKLLKSRSLSSSRSSVKKRDSTTHTKDESSDAIEEQLTNQKSENTESMVREDVKLAKYEVMREFQKLEQKYPNESKVREEVNIAKAEVMKGLQKLEKKYLTSKEKKLLERSSLDTSRTDESLSDTVVESETQKSTIASEPDKSSSGSISTSIRTVITESKASLARDVSFKSSLSPKKASIQSPTPRLRHSSAESGDDSHAHQDTSSDHSDIEIRIAALQEQLQHRMMTAAKLKKEQRREKRDKLKTQEDTLKKQIEVYDNLINQGRAELATEKSDSGKFSKPIIKSPKSNLSERSISYSPQKDRALTPELTSNSVSLVYDEASGSVNASDSSQKTASLESNSTIVASPERRISVLQDKQDSPPLETNGETLQSISEVIEEALTSLTHDEEYTSIIDEQSDSSMQDKTKSENSSQAKTKSENSSQVKTISEHSSLVKSTSEISSQVKSKSEESSETKTKSDSYSQIKTKSDISSPTKTESQETVSSKSESHHSVRTADHEEVPVRETSVVIEARKPTKKDIADKNVDSITEHIMNQLVSNSMDEMGALLKKTSPKLSTSPVVTKPTSSSPTKTKKTYSTSLSPRSKPQDLMLTTFDLSSESSEESSLQKSGTPTDSPDLEDQEFQFNADGVEFIDDDYGLSTIRQEAENLRRQQLKIEQEILKIQQGDSEPPVMVRQIPDKPPPPYVPPQPPKPEPKPPPPKPCIPTFKDDISGIVYTFVKILHSARENFIGVRKVEFQEAWLEEEDGLSDGDKKSWVEYHKMLFQVVVEVVDKIYINENAVQNPPWMHPKPLAKMKYMTPKSAEQLNEWVKKEVLAFLKLAPKVQRENLLISWAGKKRDRVDEILVRELQEEESLWTDYSNEEALVKTQVADTLFENLLTDTALTFAAIYDKKLAQTNQ